MTASVVERTALAADLVKLVIRTDWEQPHQAGQYLQLSLPGYEGAHYFSIASAPSNFPEVTLLVRIGSSALDQAMAVLRADDAVNLSSPNGRFRASPTGDSLFFVGGGTGIAPMLSMVLDLAAQGETRPLRLIYGYRHERECGFDEELAALEASGVQVQRIIGAPITLDESLLDGQAPTGHICGPPAMIEALQAQAKALGLSPLLTEPY